MESSALQVSLSADRVKIEFSAETRESLVRLADLLPALRSITNSVVEAAIQREGRAARSVSCKAGCGACCRQLVPITSTEARQIPQIVSSLSEEHRERVISRFEAVRSRLREVGMWSRLESMAALTAEERLALSLEYFALGIACPFLENESCSIHAQRPLMCRQYLVTSPALIHFSGRLGGVSARCSQAGREERNRKGTGRCFEHGSVLATRRHCRHAHGWRMDAQLTCRGTSRRGRDSFDSSGTVNRTGSAFAPTDARRLFGCADVNEILTGPRLNGDIIGPCGLAVAGPDPGPRKRHTALVFVWGFFKRYERSGVRQMLWAEMGVT